MDLNSRDSDCEMDSIPDGQGALLELEAMEMWEGIPKLEPIQSAEIVEVVDEEPWWVNFEIGSVEGQKREDESVPEMTQFSRSYSPLGEIELESMEQGLEQQDNSMGSMASEDDMDPDYIPDGQAEWMEMERKAGRFYD
ncbi:hypothetical protein GCK72_013090 [Caenorhabditis remanei]|uniref:Uncharacterized protein n=1 Tax=Caenorhabditis remanei TaxID=31234 RepID=A0A6A5GQ32_CAERE|nr:hypothetical protein GCK72_013090 [Caenorhabditis remanei]KAF1756636.1 hypothetical protein GCK72_013090 [Caenorhabditis remanei]